MHEMLRARTSGDGRAYLLGYGCYGPRSVLETPQRTQVLEEGGIPTRRREVPMMLDEGVRLRRQAVPGDSDPQHPGVEGRGNLPKQPTGRQVRPCQEPVGPLIHSLSLAKADTGTPLLWGWHRGNRAPPLTAPSV